MDLIRAGLDISVGRWKALLIAFCLFSATVMGIEGVAAFGAIARGTEGRLGIEWGDDHVMHQGRIARQVRGFRPWSLAPQAGVRAGDLLQLERWTDNGRAFRPGEVIAVTLVRDGQALRAAVPVIDRPMPSLERWRSIVNATLCGLGTLFGLVIGLRQAQLPTSRALALTFLWWSFNMGARYAPADWPMAVVRISNFMALAPGWYLGLWFAVHYPDEVPQGWRRVLRRLLPVFLAGLVVVEGVTLAVALDRTTDLFNWVHVPYVGVAGALMLVAFWDGWRRSAGERRQRFAWLLGAFSLYWAVSYATYVGDLLDVDAIMPWLSLLAMIGSLLALIGLSYAILRHRVLDMGLALNRSLVFAVVGAVLLGSFHFLQVLAARLLHFDDPAKAGLLSAVLAALVVLAYPKVKPRAEWLVDRLFFSDWVAREADLKRFAGDARGFSDAAALARSTVGAVDRFTAGAGAALYVRGADGRFERDPGSTLASPPALEVDEPLVVALRAGHRMARCDEVHSALPAECALIVSRQREPEAFMLIGRQRDGRALRADEVAALGEALPTVGTEWQALRWEALNARR